MNTVCDFTTKQRSSPNLVCTSVAFDNQDVPFAETPTLKLSPGHLEVSGIIKKQTIALNVRNCEVSHWIRGCFAMRAFLDTSCDIGDVTDGFHLPSLWQLHTPNSSR